MSDAKEGWMIFGGGHGAPAIAVPASVGAKILENFVVIDGAHHDPCRVINAHMPVTIVSADTMTTARAKYKMLGDVQISSELDVAKLQAVKELMQMSKMEMQVAMCDTASKLRLK